MKKFKMYFFQNYFQNLKHFLNLKSEQIAHHEEKFKNMNQLQKNYDIL
jgi:hypothetical protein